MNEARDLVDKIKHQINKTFILQDLSNQYQHNVPKVFLYSVHSIIKSLLDQQH